MKHFIKDQKSQKGFHDIYSFWIYFLYESLLLPLILLFIVTTLIVSPVGEFALNDDWIFAQVVKEILETGSYRGHPYLSATFVAQAYWGVFFCKIWGFSFTTLRASTLVLSCIGAWLVGRCALSLGLGRNLALACAFLVAANPIYLSLSYSFMTDVPFFTACALSGWLLLEALRKQDFRLIFLGNVFAVIAFYVRQFGVLIPLAFVITLGILWWKKQYRFSWQWLAALLLPWFFGGLIHLYLKAIQVPGSGVFQPIGERLPMVIMDGVRIFPIAFCYLGLFCLPIGSAMLWQYFCEKKTWLTKQVIILMSSIALTLLVFFLPHLLSHLLFDGQKLWLNSYPVRLPLLREPKTLRDLGLGGPLLHDAPPPVQIHDFWWLFTLAALVVQALLVLKFFDIAQKAFAQQSNRVETIQVQQQLFLVVWIFLFIATAFNPWRTVIPDRYFLSCLMPALILLASDLREFRLRGAFQGFVLTAACFYVFSIVGIQDFMAWNGAAWAASYKLVNQYGVSSHVISGVGTFNGWHNSEAYMQRYNTTDWNKSNEGGFGDWALDNQYVITMDEPKAGYEEFDRVSYFSWLGMTERNMTILERID
ncbi:MAG TPA: glycosyltransferase family 39 protein [Synechococcales cyanobacterium M55_K2018_004]|nr:glycosyltransferase family 39 protein [Synechococcales cyanobacterium M55_K2018_004]